MKSISMLLAGLLFCAVPISQVMAGDPLSSANCIFTDGITHPDDDPDGKSMPYPDNEFGPGATAVTRCLANTNNGNITKVVFGINWTMKPGTTDKPYGMPNIKKAIKDYEVTHGMVIGEDFEVVAVVHSQGWQWVMNETGIKAGTNPNPALVSGLIEKGVKVFICQNTSRKIGIQKSDLLEGVGFITAGVTAILDFQMEGYTYIQP